MKVVITGIYCIVGSVILSQTYFNKYQQLADSLESVYKIPSSVMLAIAYYESGGGKSILARRCNNHFGIIGKNPYLRSKYRYFTTDTASYEGFCKLICNKTFYRRLAGNTDPTAWIAAIARSGYASNADAWRHQIMLIIRRHDLS